MCDSGVQYLELWIPSQQRVEKRMHFKMESNGLVSVLQYELDQQKYFSHGFERGENLKQISLFQSLLILLNHKG